MADVLELPFDQVNVLRSSRAADQAVSSSLAALSQSSAPRESIFLGEGGLPDDFRLQIRFKTLAAQWKRETAHVSSVAKTSMHPAYQAIIGMGERVLPLIFADLRDHGGHWFWALHAITQQDPARGYADLATAARIWLDWAQARGILR